MFNSGTILVGAMLILLLLMLAAMCALEFCFWWKRKRAGK